MRESESILAARSTGKTSELTKRTNESTGKTGESVLASGPTLVGERVD